MCGIVAVFRKKKEVDGNICEAFREMWWAMQLRGKDGSGLMQLKEVGKTTVLRHAKDSYTPEYNLIDDNFKDIISDVDVAPFTVGHVRASTAKAREITDYARKRNTHPFVEDNIALVHNGVFHTLPSSYQKAAGVDSHSFTLLVADVGFEQAINEVSGAYAIIYIDHYLDQAYVLRNEDRPLWQVDTRDSLIFVSEWGVARWICNRNGIPIASITEVPANMLHTFATFDPKPEVNFLKPVFSERKFRGTTYSIDSYRKFTEWQNKDKLSDEEKKMLHNCGYPSFREFTKHSHHPIMENLGRRVQGILDLKPKVRGGANGLTSVSWENEEFKLDERVNIRISEIHNHDKFCAVIGHSLRAVDPSKIEFHGNISKPQNEIARQRHWTGKITKIEARSDRSGIFDIYMKELEPYIIHAANQEQVEELRAKRVTNALDIWRAGGIPNTSSLAIEQSSGLLLDLRTCQGCKGTFHKDALKAYHKFAPNFRSDKQEVVGSMMLCMACIDECKKDSDWFFKSKGAGMNVQGMTAQ